MRNWSKLGWGLIIGICLAWIIGSIYPGFPGNGDILPLMLLSIIFLPTVLFFLSIFAIMIAFLWYRHRQQVARPTAAQIFYPLLIPIVTGLLIHGQFPRRLAFAISLPAFETLRSQVPTSPPGLFQPQQAGLYHVQKSATDRSGGQYFLVYAGTEDLNRSRVIGGFAYQPELPPRPFQADIIQLEVIGDGWYWFTANQYRDDF
jgi:heme/copper-type cytochrome/quinol oxidase subunit 2